MTSSGPEPAWAPPPPPAVEPAAGRRFDRSRLTTVDLLVAGGAVLYLLVGLLPWASVTFDLAGRITASGYEFSALVVLSALLLLGAGAWALLPAVRAGRPGFLRAAPALVLAALALLCTLIAWLRSLDYGFQFPALLGVLAAAAVTVLAASSLLPELRAWSGRQAGPAGALTGSRPGAEQPPQLGGPLGGPPQDGRPHYGQPAEPWQPPVGPERPRPAPDR